MLAGTTDRGRSSRWRRLHGVLALCAGAWLAMAAGGVARAGNLANETPARPETATSEPEHPSWLLFHDLTSACTGECGLHVYTGRFVDSSMKAIFGLNGFKPIWDWEWADSGIIAAALSRPVVSFSHYADIEAEVGAAQRFGQTSSPEVWGALYFRWKEFPWNDTVKTTVAVSTGLNYAFKLDRLEVAQAGNGEGSKLLHFMSPEVTFALPEKPDLELVFRFHHRSGGKNFLLGDTKIFNSTSGGAQYGTVGLRYRF